MLTESIRRPHRVTHRYVQRLQGTAAAVFPLLCPVREREWVPGWSPLLVLSETGVAEPGCIFVTADREREATWVVTRHDSLAGIVEMVKVTPGYLVTQLHIALKDISPAACHAEVTYTYTALSQEGEEFVEAQTPEAYLQFMQDWERHLNGFLTASTSR